VQPNGPSAMPLTLHVTAKTLYRKAGADAEAAAFAVGAPVSVIARGLPSGLLMASIVSDKIGDAIAEKAALKPVSLVGTAVAVQSDQGLLTLAPRTRPRQTLAVVDATRIKVETAEATLAQILPGMRVSARLSRQKDASGHVIAASLSAFSIKSKPAKKTAPIKTP
jgi:hypothetical protein